MVKCLVFLSLFSKERKCVLYCFMNSRKEALCDDLKVF